MTIYRNLLELVASVVGLWIAGFLLSWNGHHLWNYPLVDTGGGLIADAAATATLFAGFGLSFAIVLVVSVIAYVRWRYAHWFELEVDPDAVHDVGDSDA